MTFLNELLQYNEEFVKEKKYLEYSTTKFPDKKMVVLTCMDTRLTELLPKALNFKNGDIKLIKNAGAVVSHPFGSIMRSILLAIYELEASEVLVIGHHDCGMSNLEPESVLKSMMERGIRPQAIETLRYSGIPVYDWMRGFKDVNENVTHSVEMITKHPLLPKDIAVHGLVINPETGKLDLIINGYEN